MSKKTYVAAIVLPALAAVLMAAAQGPDPGVPQAADPKSPEAIAARKKAFEESRYQPNTAFANIVGVKSKPDPRGLDLTITTVSWVGPKFRGKLGGGGKGFLLVEAYDPEGNPVSQKQSKVFPFLVGVRDNRTFNVQLPLPQNPQGYPVTVTLLSTEPEGFRTPDGEVQERPWVLSRRKTTVVVPSGSKTAAK
jgi:hypothetical protein